MHLQPGMEALCRPLVGRQGFLVPGSGQKKRREIARSSMPLASGDTHMALNLVQVQTLPACPIEEFIKVMSELPK